MIIVKKPKTGFSIIPNSIIQNEDVSAVSRLLWVYLASLPDDWTPRAGHLQTALGVGRDRLQAACKELEGAGLLRRKPNRTEGGEIHGQIWELITADRVPENQACGVHRVPEGPAGGFSGTLQRTHIQSPPSPSGKTPPRGSAAGSRLSEDWTPSEENIEYAISKGLDRNEINRIAEDFADHWISKPGKDGRKANWDRTWQKWIRTDVDRKSQSIRRPAALGKPSGQDVAKRAAAIAIERRLGRSL